MNHVDQNKDIITDINMQRVSLYLENTLLSTIIANTISKHYKSQLITTV